MRILTKIKTKIKHKTPHQRTCLYALVFMGLMTLFSAGLSVVWPQCPFYGRLVLTSSIPLVLVLVLYGRVRQLRIKSFYRLHPILPKAVLTWVLFGIGANCFATMINIPFYSFLVESKGLVAPEVRVPQTSSEYIMGIVVIAVLPAVLEELFCRGIVLREYESYGTVFSVFAAASVFAMLHMSLTSFVFTWILGIVLALVVLKTDSIYPAMIVHFSTNLFSLTRAYLTSIMHPMFYELWTGIQIFLFVIFGFGFAIVMFMLLLLHGKEHLKSRDKTKTFGFSFSFCVLLAIYIANHARLIVEMFKN